MEYLCKRGSGDQNFQQWQDLSPKEQEKMRKKIQRMAIAAAGRATNDSAADESVE